MLFRKLQATIGLKCPHTVQVFAATTSRKDRFVLVMEHMSGGDLRTLMRQEEEPLPDVWEHHIMEYMCSGMAFLNNRDMIDGDLESANVFFDSAGTVKVTRKNP